MVSDGTPVVVGWSGSEVSDRAVDVAAAFAARHGVELRIVLGWDFLNQPQATWNPHLTEADVEAELASVVARVRAGRPELTVTGTVLMGWPPTVFRTQTPGAQLVVVGRSDVTRGHFGDWSVEALVRDVSAPLVFVP